jgi:hypothetical protein
MLDFRVLILHVCLCTDEGTDWLTRLPRHYRIRNGVSGRQDLGFVSLFIERFTKLLLQSERGKCRNSQILPPSCVLATSTSVPLLGPNGLTSAETLLFRPVDTAKQLLIEVTD